MGAGLLTEVLLGLYDDGDGGATGTELHSRLAARRPGLRADDLLVALLRLEAAQLVDVARGDQLRFSLTAGGRIRAEEAGGGRPEHVRLLMADLVGFVAFTDEHGDEAARDAAGDLARAAASAVRAHGGEVVKGLGDGFLAWLPPTADPIPVLTELAGRCARPSGQRWQLRAASHVGRPLRQGTDLFGGDVNLVARLCAEASPDELLLTRPPGTGRVEHLAIRGLAAPVAVARVAIG